MVNPEDNNKIARFIGVDVDYSPTVYKDSKSPLRHLINNLSKDNELLFHKSWDWLMPVMIMLKKFQNESNDWSIDNFEYSLNTFFTSIYYWKNKKWEKELIYYIYDPKSKKLSNADSEIDVVYKGVIDIINSYNKYHEQIRKK